MMFKLVAIIAAAAACLLVVSAELDIKEKELPCDRLPSNVVPTKYELELKFASIKEAQTYQGQVNISLKFPHKDEELTKGLAGETCKWDNSNIIVLHADRRVELENIEVISESCGALDCFAPGERKRSIRSVRRDSKKQLLAIKLWKGIKAGGEGRLSIKFRGSLRDDQRGIYRSTYTNADDTYSYIVSQFQPTDARTVFPLFDEPRFKARFQVRLVFPRGNTALSNTEVESESKVDLVPGYSLRVTTFKETLPMAAHMLAFTIGHFGEPLEVTAKSAFAAREFPVRVFTAPGKRESGQFALDVAWKSLEHFEKYIDYKFPLRKFDIVAIADLERDNTESWGLAFIRDTLVWIDDETKPDTKITTAVNVAHVCVHQWFGNLISVAWWNDLWITEGVAAQFAFKIVRDLYPEFQSEYFVRLATLSGVMQLDAPGDQHALAPPLDELRTSADIYRIFDNIEFMKSASLAQTMNKWFDKMQDEWYQRFLRTLVRRHALETVNYTDFWWAISSSVGYRFWTNPIPYDDIEALLKSQTSIQGVPLVNVRQNESGVFIDTELLATASHSFFTQNEPSKFQVLMWDTILIEHVSEEDNRRFGICPRLMDPFSNTVHIWGKQYKYVKLGADPDINTYYRTRYEDSGYKSFCEPIGTRAMSAMDRLQILDDANVLVQRQLIHSDTFKQLVDCYADEDDGAVLLQLMVALKTLASLKGSSPSSKAVLNIFTKYGFTVTGKETFLEQRSRQVILKALITQGNQQVIEAALRAFDEAQGNVALFLREPVYTAVVLAGTGEQVEQLKAKLVTTKSHEEKLRLVNALALSKDKAYLMELRSWLSYYTWLKPAETGPIIDSIKRKLL